MASPVSGAIPTPGNLLSSQSLAASASAGLFLDVSADFAESIFPVDTTGATAAATSGLQVQVFGVYGTTTTDGTTTNNGTGVSIGGTAVDFASISGVHKGQKVALAGALGELVTVSAVGGGGSTRSQTISATQYAQANGSNVYTVTQTAQFNAVLGQNLTAANTTYATQIELPTGRWWVQLTNLDATNAVNVEVSGIAITGVA